jgi:AraC-like DNA-binding protein
MPLPHWNKFLTHLLKSRPIYALDSEERDKTHRHCQPGFELNLTCRGRGLLHVGSHTFSLAPGTLVFIPEGIVHQLEAQTPGRYARSVLCVAPPPDAADPFLHALHVLLRRPVFCEPRCLHLDDESARLVRGQISRIATESRRQAAWWREIVSGMTYELLAVAARLSLQRQSSPPPGGHLAAKAAAYAASHLDGDLTSQAVAAHFGVSREHLSRSFHQHFGITFQNHVLTQRINAARRLLTEAGLTSLLDIALAVGFQSHSNFSRVFRKHEGITPAQFRALHRIGG